MRWLCALIGLALAATSALAAISALAQLAQLAQLAPLWFAGAIAVGALLLVFEMAPGGYANRA